jgi:hypothetical protein
VVECRAPLGGAFHPKIWVLRFHDGDEALVRFLCLSRNLTFDRCWDTALLLDGRVRGRNQRRNRPLAEFVQALPELAVRAPDGERAARIDQLATNVLKADWEIPAPFERIAFHPLGHRRTASPWPFRDARIDRMLIVAPFVSATTLARLSAEGEGNLLVGRADQLDRCDPEGLEKQFSERLVLGDEAVDDSGEAERGGMRGLHAKLYVADQGWKSTVWTGSANATESAFSRNVEFLVELAGPKNQVGIGAVLGSADELKLRSLLVAYTRPGAELPETEAMRRLEREAGELRRRLATAGLALRALPGDEGGAWDMILEAPRAIEATASLASFECWPVTRERVVGGRSVSLGGSQPLARFSGLPLELLTPFLACRGVLREGNTEISEEFVLNLPLLDDPKDRRAQLLRSMLSSRAEVLRYLLYLLTGDSVEAVRALADVVAETGAGDGSQPVLEVPLLESLLRTLDRDPEKLKAVARVVGELEEAEGGASLLPDGWDAVWDPVSAVARTQAG